MAQQVKNPPTTQKTQETWARSLGQEDPLEEENDNPFQYSYLKHPVDRGASQATVQSVVKYQTGLRD